MAGFKKTKDMKTLEDYGFKRIDESNSVFKLNKKRIRYEKEETIEIKGAYLYGITQILIFERNVLSSYACSTSSLDDAREHLEYSVFTSGGHLAFEELQAIVDMKKNGLLEIEV